MCFVIYTLKYFCAVCFIKCKVLLCLTFKNCLIFFPKSSISCTKCSLYKGWESCEQRQHRNNYYWIPTDENNRPRKIKFYLNTMMYETYTRQLFPLLSLKLDCLFHVKRKTKECVRPNTVFFRIAFYCRSAFMSNHVLFTVQKNKTTAKSCNKSME